MSWPKTSTTPLVLLTSEVTMPMAVVLPAPLGPSSAKKSPFGHVKIDAFERHDPVLVDLGEVAQGEGLHKSRVA